MALNNKNDLNITGLKATFFDLFRNHTADIVKMIESLADGQTEDVVNIETSIFQRIILLNKTANSIDDLGKDIDSLSLLKSNDDFIKSKDGAKDNAFSNKQVSSDSKIVTTPAEISSTDSVHTSPEVAVTSKPLTSSNLPSQIVDQAIQNPAQNTSDVSAITKDPSSQQANALAPKTENDVQGNDSLKIPDANVSKEQIIPAPSTNVVENKQSKEPISFIKRSNKKAKAILVNTKQFSKLMTSRQRQFGLLDFDTYSNEDVSSKIESLMKKASSLYKEGKVSEAQAMYAEISALNKKLRQEQGRDKVLMKKAA